MILRNIRGTCSGLTQSTNFVAINTVNVVFLVVSRLDKHSEIHYRRYHQKSINRIYSSFRFHVNSRYSALIWGKVYPASKCIHQTIAAYGTTDLCQDRFKRKSCKSNNASRKIITQITFSLFFVRDSLNLV